LLLKLYIRNVCLQLCVFHSHS